MEKDGGWLQMENVIVGSEVQVENYSGWLQPKNGGGLPRRTAEVSFGDGEVENISIRLWSEKSNGWLQMENVIGERFAAGE